VARPKPLPSNISHPPEIPIFSAFCDAIWLKSI
jgi:hypothetical protein